MKLGRWARPENQDIQHMPDQPRGSLPPGGLCLMNPAPPLWEPATQPRDGRTRNVHEKYRKKCPQAEILQALTKGGLHRGYGAKEEKGVRGEGWG